LILVGFGWVWYIRYEVDTSWVR